jgi:hypothetical protein
LGGTESKPRDLVSDRGYRVANGDIAARRGYKSLWLDRKV